MYKIMARLISYKVTDENRYTTFISEMSCNSNENLTESNKIKFLVKNKKKKDKKCISKTSPSLSVSPLKSNRMKKQKTVPIAKITPTVQTINLPSSSSSTATIITATNRTSSKSKVKNCCSLFSCNWIFRNKRCYKFKRRLKRCCCCCCLWCCKKQCAIMDDDDDFDDDEDDDIDAKFEQYKNELRLKELAANANSADVKNRILQQQQQQSKQQNGTDVNNDAKNKFSCKKYWNWNDSWRSNSDRFLETLEYDMDGDRSLKRSSYKNPIIRITKG